MALKESEIQFKVGLDENNVPEQIGWKASGGQGEGMCKAAFISIWDEKDQNTMKIDLWTKDMKVDEMKVFFHQTLVSMTETLERSTGEAQMASDMRQFCQYFGEELGLLKKPE